MLRARFHEILYKSIKAYIREVKAEIANSIIGFIVEEDDELYIYNLEVSKIDSFPIYECAGGETSPTNGCHKLFTDTSIASQHSFKRKYPKDCQILAEELDRLHALNKLPMGKEKLIDEVTEDREIYRNGVRSWLRYLKDKNVVTQDNQGYHYHPNQISLIVCPFCGGTEFNKYESREEYEEVYLE